jgi:hypothetical protein
MPNLPEDLEADALQWALKVGKVPSALWDAMNANAQLIEGDSSADYRYSWGLVIGHHDDGDFVWCDHEEGKDDGK